MPQDAGCPSAYEVFTHSMISSATNGGKLYFMVYAGALNTRVFVKFLRRLTADARQKMFVTSTLSQCTEFRP
jgi:hypothetical protein